MPRDMRAVSAEPDHDGQSLHQSLNMSPRMSPRLMKRSPTIDTDNITKEEYDVGGCVCVCVDVCVCVCVCVYQLSIVSC